MNTRLWRFLSVGIQQAHLFPGRRKEAQGSRTAFLLAFLGQVNIPASLQVTLTPTPWPDCLCICSSCICVFVHCPFVYLFTHLIFLAHVLCARHVLGAGHTEWDRQEASSWALSLWWEQGSHQTILRACKL